MGDLRLDLVAVDAPNLPGLFPSGWVQSSPRAYVRLHSRNADNWYPDHAVYNASKDQLKSMPQFKY